jgi:hypothetical protein
MKERKRVERERIASLVFKLATVALPINANPYVYNPNPPMQEHSWCLRAANSSIYYWFWSIGFSHKSEKDKFRPFAITGTATSSL